jgi:hypothetical protein
MTDDEQPQQSRGSLEFVESSIIQTVIPEHTELSLEEGLRASLAKDGDVDAALQDITLRQAVFFGKLMFGPLKANILLIIRIQMKYWMYMSFYGHHI